MTMKEIQTHKTNRPNQGKKTRIHHIHSLKRLQDQPVKEKQMNPFIMTLLSITGLGILVFLALKISRVTAPKPILIEQRRIIYRRRP